MLASGRLPPRRIAAAAAALVALGGWSLLSISWGGNVDAAWSFAARSLLAAAALVVGGALRPRLRRAAVTGIAAGIAVVAIELVARVGFASAPADWLYGRTVDGPVGYHNAQGALFAVGLALTAPALVSPHARARAAAGAAGGVFLSALLLTQSRGALAAAVLGVATAVAAMRDARLGARSLALAVAAVPLVAALRGVDTYLGTVPRPDAAPLHTYAATTAGVSVALAAAALVPLTRRQARSACAIALAATCVVAGTWLWSPITHAARSATESLRTDLPPASRSGATRYASLSLNGRYDMWRVARHLWAADPVRGGGTGTFARAWTEQRRSLLYVLQPHSIELELGAELGIVGLATFVVALGLAVSSLHRLRGPPAAAAAAALVVLVAQASIDWTWSFPALVVPVLFAVGAAARGRRRRVPGRATVTAAGVAAGAVGAACLVPFVVSRDYASAATLSATQPAKAATKLAQARKLDPWSAPVALLQGDIALRAGDAGLAAKRYAHAARVSITPWAATFSEALALRRAGRTAAADAACRSARRDNPLEPLLRGGACRTVSWQT